MEGKVLYLIDTENVGTIWKNLIGDEKKDKVYVFYTEQSPRISYDDFKQLLDLPRKIELIKCCAGRNALDFQLVSFLGHLLAKSKMKSEQYYIVSNDKGFDPVCEFWTERGYKVERMSATQEEQYEERVQLLKEVIPSEYEEKTEAICQFFREKGMFDLQDVHNFLIKLVGNEDGNELYKILRPYIKTII